MSRIDIVLSNRSYAVQCEDGQEAHLQKLARYVDHKVGELTASLGQVGEARLFLLAALTITDELHEANLNRANPVERDARSFQAQTNSKTVNGAFEPAISINYSYSLVRCQQSKFVSNWELGGLDVDEGHYAAVWDRGSRSLFIEAQKRIRYSTQADVFQGFSSILNLLAPAVTSMLMKHLAYEGVLQYLESKRADLSALPANDARRSELPNDPITGLFTAVS